MSAQSSRKSVARWLEPFAAALWIFFVVWSVMVAAVWLSGFGQEELSDAVRNPDLRGALAWMLSALDGLWVLLAAANVYVPLASVEGLKTARTRALFVALVAWGLAAVAARSSLPLGPIAYSDRLGPSIGSVPFGMPLLWLALVLGAREAALRLAPRASHWKASLLAALLVLLSDLNLEPIAWKLRVWWLWYPRSLTVPNGPPFSAYATWLVAAWALTFAFRERDAARARSAPPARPAAVFAVLNAIFLFAHFARR